MAYHHEYQLANGSIYAEPKAIPKKLWPRIAILITLGLIATIGVVSLTVHFMFNSQNNFTSVDNQLPSTQATTESLYEQNFKASLNQSQKDVIDLVSWQSNQFTTEEQK